MNFNYRQVFINDGEIISSFKKDTLPTFEIDDYFVSENGDRYLIKDTYKIIDSEKETVVEVYEVATTKSVTLNQVLSAL